MPLVEKVFVPQEALRLNRFSDILTDMSREYTILSGNIVDFGKACLGQALKQSRAIALADRLSYAAKPLGGNLEIPMPPAWGIKHIYPAEFAIGEEALNIIKAETGIDFPKTEAAADTPRCPRSFPCRQWFFQLADRVEQDPEAAGVEKIRAEALHVEVRGEQVRVLLGKVKRLFHKTDGPLAHLGQGLPLRGGQGQRIRGQKVPRLVYLCLYLGQNRRWNGLSMLIVFHKNSFYGKNSSISVVSRPVYGQTRRFGKCGGV
jgi:hypothetical protein